MAAVLKTTIVIVRKFLVHFSIGCFLLWSCNEALHIGFPRDLGCCRPVSCPNGHTTNCPNVTECSPGEYVRNCPGCCGHCEKSLKNGDKCWQMMDLAFCRYGKCESPLICSRNGSCLSPEVGQDWGRGDEYQPFVE